MDETLLAAAERGDVVPNERAAASDDGAALAARFKEHERQLRNEAEAQPDRLRAHYCEGKADAFRYCANAVTVSQASADDGAARPQPAQAELPSPMPSFDARVWAESFVAHVKKYPHIPTDEGTMLAWFASALMRGFDEGKRQSEHA